MKYSIIIPVYNKANTIAESIYSIINQTEQDYEIIVINDGSTDNIHEVLKPFHTIHLIDQDNGGVSIARNAGILAAKGDYICFLDADDLWLPNHLEELSTLIDEFPSARMFVTSHIETNYSGEVYHSSNSFLKFAKRFLCDNLFELLNNISYNIVHTNSMCVDRKIFYEKNIWFEPGEKIGEDTDVWYRVALCCSVAISQNETTIYRKENSTATQNGNNSFTWVFARRWESINAGCYSEEKKIECRKLIDRYKMAISRDYILLRERTRSKQILKDVYYHNTRYLITWLLSRLPYRLSIWIITQR